MQKSLLILFTIFVSSCNPFYVINSAYQGSKIIINRKKIDTVIKENKIEKLNIKKLKYVLKAKEFAKIKNLDSKNAFNYYTQLDKSELSWIVMASKKEKFELKTWWFPIVGSVPYKGFFKKKDAISYSISLENKGYETFVRPTSAYSTLGWFDDPITSPLLESSITQIINTVFHELVHKSVWIKNHVDFNETLATYIGDVLTIKFFEKEKNKEYLIQAKKIFKHDFQLSKVLTKLYINLNTLYNSNQTLTRTLKKRELLFKNIIKEYKKYYPSSTSFNSLNNAEIMQSYIYLKEFDKFDSLFKALNLESFLLKIKEIEAACHKKCEPFKLIEKDSDIR